MKQILIIIALALIGCETGPRVCSTVIEIGNCTEESWSSQAKCAVKLDNGDATVIPAPVIEGIQVCLGEYGYYRVK